jgi:AraC-like DNA-binding protein
MDLSTSFGDFCQKLGDTFFPLSYPLPKDRSQPLVSEFVTRRFGPLHATEAFVSSTFPVIGRQGRAPIQANGPGKFVLVAMRSGLVTQRQFGRTVEAAPRTLVLVDSRSPFWFRKESRDTGGLYLNIPGPILRTALGAPEGFCGIRLDAHKGLPAVLHDFLFSTWEQAEEMDEAERALVAQQIVDSLLAILRQTSRPALSSPPLHPRFEDVIGFVKLNLDDPDLGPPTVASALGLSLGHLHAIVRKKGTTLGRMVLNMRLERCRDALADPRWRDKSIGEIAFEWGFNNAGHFSTAFRKRYGLAPRAFRRQREAFDRSAAPAAWS